MDPTLALEVSDLSAGYRNRPVIDRLSLDPLRPGEVSALVGPNAAPAGPVGPHNSLIGTVQSAFQNVPYAYDPARGRLVVGRPLENRVTLMYLPTRELFSDGFE